MFEARPAPESRPKRRSEDTEKAETDPAGGTLIEERPASAGRYVLRETLGRGSMGEVWCAEDPEIGRHVAVKVLHLPSGLDASRRHEWEQRFHREARAAGSLSHPGIVSVHDVGTTGDGRPFIVMELVEGRDLEAIIREGPVPAPALVLSWGAQVASALDEAHRRDIIHRDVKPANILIDTEGRARITDFGIARLSASELTSDGLFLGSPAYAAPEQLQGALVDRRTDLFSLGASLYAVLTGVRPFKGEDLSSLAYAICHTGPAPPEALVAGLPAGCDRFFSRALAKDPALRYQTGAEFSEALESLVRGAPVSSSDRPPARAGAARSLPARETPNPGQATGSEFERRAAEIGSRTAALIARTTLAVIATTRRCARWIRAAWIRGWGMGPRVRAGMLAGSLVLLIALACGGYALARQIAEARRDSPSQKLKKAFKTLVGARRPAPDAGDSDSESTMTLFS